MLLGHTCSRKFEPRAQLHTYCSKKKLCQRRSLAALSCAKECCSKSHKVQTLLLGHTCSREFEPQAQLHAFCTTKKQCQRRRSQAASSCAKNALQRSAKSKRC